MSGVRILGFGLAAGLIGLGVLLTAFALGWISGTAAEGSRLYAMLGPLLAALGVALVIVMQQNRGR